MTEDLLRAYKATIDFWVEDLKVKPLVPPDVVEVSAPGAVMQEGNVKVAATIVQHPPVRPALAYPLRFPRPFDRVFGRHRADRRRCAVGKGRRHPVHEAMYVPALETYIRDRIGRGAPIRFEDYMTHMKVDHSPVEDVGRVGMTLGSKPSSSRT
jgi:hypothetical protein